ncbi:hypothetical protein CEXT_218601 [Caerostris extrusa]|uniref:Cytochrome P450 n=1 Tax=Caerostris extrusa TaxID=172846 RepID=A0AAV4NG33_CAEEX|nr:hypothetical protein CEXT_218601 [Caerostris extrusa]
MEVILALLCVIVVLWIAWRWQKTSVFQKLGIPGPEPSLFFGNLLELYKSNTFFQTSVKKNNVSPRNCVQWSDLRMSGHHSSISLHCMQL